MADHTPGPWFITIDPENDRPLDIVTNDPDHRIAFLTFDGNPADAHLIANAPDLLSGCRMALVSLRERRSFVDMPERPGDIERVREFLRAAIRRAEGNADG